MDSIRRAGLVLVLFASVGCATEAKNYSCSSRRSLPSMGTFIQISVKHACNKKIQDQLFISIQNRLDQIEKQFSLYIQDSDLMKWNRGNRSFKPGPDFNKLFGISRNLKVRTLSYFDVTALKSKGTPHSFDGIAKGYAVDEVAELIQKQSYPYYQINFSGNLRWNMKSSSGAAASSGNKHRPGHILNPKTGKVILSKSESLVQGPSAMICDALSTAYFAAPSVDRASIEKNFPNYSFSMGD